MARKPQPQVEPETLQDPQVTPEVAPEVMPEVAPQETPQGPRIEYFGEGAENVKFTVNPKATLIRVFNDGQVMETL